MAVLIVNTTDGKRHVFSEIPFDVAKEASAILADDSTVLSLNYESGATHFMKAHIVAVVLES